MRSYEFTVTSADAAGIRTEMIYSLAEGRVGGCDIIVCRCPSARVFSMVSNVLRELKKEKRIPTYQRAAALSDDSTESRYLLNKFPELDGETADDKAFVVKI